MSSSDDEPRRGGLGLGAARDDLSDEDVEFARPMLGRGRGGGRGGRGSALPAAARPMAFVSSSATRRKAAQEAAKEAEEEAPETEEQARFQELVSEAAPPTMCNSAFRELLEKGKEPASDQGEEPKNTAPAVKPKPAKFDASFGSWQRNTSGFGAKMLAKMGFSGRLGKHENGIVNPVEAKVRPDGLGLAYGGFKEASTLKNNRAVEEELMPEERLKAKREKQEQTQQAPAERAAAQGQWRKTKRPKAKRVYRTAEELELQRAQQRGLDDVAVEPPPQRVIDMGAAAAVAGGEPLLGQELLHNVSLLASRAETAALHARHGLRAEDAGTHALREELVEARRRRDECHDVEARLRGLREQLAGLTGDETSQQLADVFARLRQDFPREYRALCLPRLAPVLAVPAMQRALEDWRPLRDGAEPAMALISVWAPVLLRAVPRLGGDGASAAAALRGGDLDDVNEAGKDAYHALLQALVLPAVRRAVRATWDPRSADPDHDAVRLLRGVQPHLAEGAFHRLLDEAVAPKLEECIAQWDPVRDPQPLHEWFLPWRELTPTTVDVLLPEVKVKLGAALTRWEAADASAEALLRPLAAALPAGALTTLLVRSVVPKLVLALDAQDVRQPPPADGEHALAWALRWQDLVPREHTVAMVVGCFLGRWRRQLRRWLGASPLGLAGPQVAAWYAAWKAQFPQPLLCVPRVRDVFSAALDDMARVAAGRKLRKAPALRHQSYHTVLAAARRAPSAMTDDFAPGSESVGPPSTTPSTSSTPSRARVPDASHVTFRDVVEEAAATANVEFVPHAKHAAVGGCTVYVFGKSTIYMRNDVVYALSGGAWVPVSLDELVRSS